MYYHSDLHTFTLGNVGINISLILQYNVGIFKFLDICFSEYVTMELVQLDVVELVQLVGGAGTVGGGTAIRGGAVGTGWGGGC